MGLQEINIAVPQIAPQEDPLRLTYEEHHLLCPLKSGGLGLDHIPIQRHRELHLFQIQVRLIIFFGTVFCIFCSAYVGKDLWPYISTPRYS